MLRTANIIIMEEKLQIAERNNQSNCSPVSAHIWSRYRRRLESRIPAADNQTAAIFHNWRLSPDMEGLVSIHKLYLRSHLSKSTKKQYYYIIVSIENQPAQIVYSKDD
jgi:hypothetical protein